MKTPAKTPEPGFTRRTLFKKLVVALAAAPVLKLGETVARAERRRKNPAVTRTRCGSGTAESARVQVSMPRTHAPLTRVVLLFTVAALVAVSGCRATAAMSGGGTPDDLGGPDLAHGPIDLSEPDLARAATDGGGDLAVVDSRWRAPTR